MTRSSFIAVATFGCICVAWVISGVWLFVASGTSRFEPAVQILGLLAGVTGILAERRATGQERRRLALTSLADELRRGAATLADPRLAPADGTNRRPRVYPRLPVSAVDAALVSGALAEQDDAGLLGRLHEWRDVVSGFNRRLDLTEMRIFTAGAAEEIPDFDRALHRSDGYLDQIRRHLHELQDYVDGSHPDLSPPGRAADRPVAEAADVR
ncbi:MAG TPA: hypothetical protein VLJ59_06595 [Mycobacteriales bacterium]|nr:hypothetical protein [Mycobacteriales bacterium]